MSRPHVFKLTDNEQAALDLYNTNRWMSFATFCRALGIGEDWFSKAHQKSMEIAQFEDPVTPHVSSLSKARGRTRMIGTR